MYHRIIYHKVNNLAVEACTHCGIDYTLPLLVVDSALINPTAPTNAPKEKSEWYTPRRLGEGIR